ncbi:MAG: carbohydrate kinase [Victivallales bacterium]|nr:carbohydrate kinase [Victivallales bacterium]
MQGKFKIVSIGEVLWDIFQDNAKFGGAPANVACHCAAMADSAYMISSVGNDNYGKAAMEFLLGRNVNIDGVSVSGKYATGTVDVAVDRQGKPEYRINCQSAWDNIESNSCMEHIVRNADALCFGSLAQRDEVSRRTIERLVALSPAACLKVFDVNLRLDFYNDDILRNSVRMADIIKLNDEELPVVGKVFGLSGNAEAVMKELIRVTDVKLVAVTRGGDGAVIISRDEESDCPGIKVDKLADTVGAGDAFTAMLISGLLRGKPLDEINHNACRLAAYICSQPGATPELPADVI